MELDELLEYTENIKSDIKELDFHEDDVRFSFFGLYYSSVYDYYIGKALFQVAKYIGTGEIKFTEKVYHFKIHAARLFEIQDHEMLVRGYHGYLNRSLLFGVWTSFELSLSLIFEHLISEEELLKIIYKINDKVIKAIKNLNEDDKNTIVENLRKTSFIPIIRKFNFIVSTNQDKYNGNLEEDRKFLEFVVKLRNCMIHSNGVYHGKEFYYKFGEEEFLFKDKEMLLQKGPNNRDVYLDIVKRIREIFENVIKCTEEIEYIEYPDDGQNII